MEFILSTGEGFGMTDIKLLILSSEPRNLSLAQT